MSLSDVTLHWNFPRKDTWMTLAASEWIINIQKLRSYCSICTLLGLVVLLGREVFLQCKAKSVESEQGKESSPGKRV
jgi:hypothetical protein